MPVKTLTDEIAHAAMKQAYLARQIVFFTDPRILGRQGSPLYNPLEVFVPPLVLLASSLTLLFAFGLIEWIVALVLIMLYQMYGAPRLVQWRVHQRAVAVILHSPLGLQRLWRLGGLAVALKRWPERNCIAPDGNWRAFVADYLVVEAEAEPGGQAE